MTDEVEALIMQGKMQTEIVLNNYLKEHIVNDFDDGNKSSNMDLGSKARAYIYSKTGICSIR